MTQETPQAAISISETPQSAQEYVHLGWKQYARGQFRDAENSFRKALELDPRLVDGHYGLAVSLRSLSRTAEAVESLQRARELVPDPSIPLEPGKRAILGQLIEAQLSILTQIETKES
jgi:tetratricopeptide (TPR) repeat protein